MKRYIYIIIAIVVVAVAAIAILLYVKNSSTGGSGSAASSTATTGPLPVAGTRGSTGSTGNAGSPLSLPSDNSSTSGAPTQSAAPSFGVLSNNPVAGYAVSAQNVVTAIQPDGEVFAVVNGQTSIVNSSTVSGIIAVSFSADGKKALVNYGNPNNPQSSIYDVSLNAWTALPVGMQSPQWSPSGGYGIAYLATTRNGGLALQTIDATSAATIKRGATTLLSLAATDLALQWPMKNYFILSDKPTSASVGSIWEFNASAGTLTALEYNTPGAESTWSANVATPYGLIFYDSGLGNRTENLSLRPLYGTAPSEQMSFLTLPSKCAFDNETMPIATSTAAGQSTSTPTSTIKTSRAISAKTAPTSTPYLALYCGVPRSSSGFSSASLPDAYNMMSLFTSDDIYKINLTTAAITPIWSDQTQNMDVSDVKIFNGTLFFVNRYDERLYGLTNVTGQ